jgi:ATP-dependent DNA helicase RecG
MSLWLIRAGASGEYEPRFFSENRIYFNQRIQQVCRDHPHDITKMLQGLVAKGLLEPDGAGRARTYRLGGTSIPDRAGIDFDILGGKTVTSPTASSSHLKGSSSHLEAVPLHLETEGKEWRELEGQVANVRNAGKAPQETMRQAILEVCKEHFLTAEQIGLLLGRDPNGLRARFLSPMQKQGLLSHRFPASPNHKDQAYRVAL